VNRYLHCGVCGAPFPPGKGAKTCTSCKNTTWINPAPVVVALTPVVGPSGRIGLVVGERGIEPSLGRFALTSGYMDADEEQGETYVAAVCREMREEITYEETDGTTTGLDMEPSRIRLYDVCSGRRGTTLLVFTLTGIIYHDHRALTHFRPNKEVRSVKVIYEPEELAFPSHTEMAARYLNGNR
jgi:8-oxo-dGTP diphosphatase